MLTLEHRCLPVVGGGVLVSRIQLIQVIGYMTDGMNNTITRHLHLNNKQVKLFIRMVSIIQTNFGYSDPPLYLFYMVVTPFP